MKMDYKNQPSYRERKLAARLAKFQRKADLYTAVLTRSLTFISLVVSLLVVYHFFS
jgi:hypothetical protein